MFNPIRKQANTRGQHDKIACLSLVLVLLLLYGLCQNGQWVPGGGDDAYYLAIARNLVTGQGYSWNAMPVVLIPPGWPAFLAVLMQLSGSFAFLNLVLLSLCVSAACMWYYILRRFTHPRRAWLVVLIASTLFEWHRFTFNFYSEALFFFLFAAAVLLAMQINEGCAPIWKIALLVVLSVALVVVRWLGLFAVAVTSLTLLSTRYRPRLNRKWLTVLLLLTVSVMAFTTIRSLQKTHALKMIDEQSSVPAHYKIQYLQGTHELKAFRGSPSTYIHRVLRAGSWLSALFWPPSNIGRSNKALELIFNILGWALIVFVFLHSLARVRRRQWIWLGLLILCIATIMISYRYVARYLAPVAPMLLLAMWGGIDPDQPAGQRSPTGKRLRRMAAAGILASIALCNLSILAVNAWVARSPDFLDLCLAGEYRDMLKVGEYLQCEPTHQAEVGVSVKYRDLIRTRGSSWARRAIVFLVDSEVIVPGRNNKALLSNDELQSWAKSQGIKYIVTRPPNVNTRLWHLKNPFLTNDLTAEELPYYILLEVSDEKMQAVDLPEVSDGLWRVLGL